ncbi:hypothetical protein ACQCZM_33915, partial [Escherichia coli]
LLFTGIERTSQIKPIPELHSAPPPITFLPIGQVAVAPGQRNFDAVTLTISISPFPAFFHEPDWHGDIAFPFHYSYLPRFYRGRQICFEKSKFAK